MPRPQLSDKLADLAGSPASMPLDGLRLLERTSMLIFVVLEMPILLLLLLLLLFILIPDLLLQDNAIHTGLDYGYWLYWLLTNASPTALR
jgi:hypothetical protein